MAINAMVATQNYADASARLWRQVWMPSYRVRASRWSCPAWWKELMLRWPHRVQRTCCKAHPPPVGKSFNRTADFVVIEGCKAGGHLGFSEEELLAGKCQTLDEILPKCWPR